MPEDALPGMPETVQRPAHRITPCLRLSSFVVYGPRSFRSNPLGEMLDMGLTERWATPEQYLALLARDRRCRFPGCRVPAKYTVVHHLVNYPLGPTDLSNLVLLCDRHHHLVHEGHWRLQRTPTGDVALYRPDGSIFETLDTS